MKIDLHLKTGILCVKRAKHALCALCVKNMACKDFLHTTSDILETHAPVSGVSRPSSCVPTFYHRIYTKCINTMIDFVAHTAAMMYHGSLYKTWRCS